MWTPKDSFLVRLEHEDAKMHLLVSLRLSLSAHVTANKGIFMKSDIREFY
jgi:hypothetical protein